MFSPSVFRTYDIRGIAGTEVTADLVRHAVAALVTQTGARTLAIGRDARNTGEALHQAAVAEAVRLGVSVSDIGVVPTEVLYYAVGSRGLDAGISVTASHNPSEWNGVKFIGKNCVPFTKTSGLSELYELIRKAALPEDIAGGTTTKVDLVQEYAEFVLKQFPQESAAPLKAVICANHGPAGQYLDALLPHLPLDPIRLYWEPNGSFPQGTPDPSLPKNGALVAKAIREHGAALGFALDADADRIFVFDETGNVVSWAYLTALLGWSALQQEAGTHLVTGPQILGPIEKTISLHGGTLVVSKTGHGFMKESMRAHDARFGAEHSGHVYHRALWYCDGGVLTLANLCQVLVAMLNDATLSGLMEHWRSIRAVTDHEYNFTAPDTQVALDAVLAAFPGEVDHLDGISIRMADWRFNLRASATEPVLRLNAEAETQELLETHLAQLQAVLTGVGATLRDDH